ncbi:MAG: hypothetical protein ACJA0Q_001106 [Saprospiraceae bacterium]|jgi:hypothetical protein
MSEIKRTASFDLAFRFITETNLNVYLTGKAGTGKTTFLRYLRDTSHKNIVVAAPTGVAAINAGGVTLHSLFQLPFAPFIPGNTPQENTLAGHPLLSQLRFNTDKRKILINMDLLVIDEISMVAANTLDSIDIILKSIRRNYQQPFGGVQVLFIGDLHQLPPVVKREHYNLFRTVYKSVYFFDSQVLSLYPPVMVELKKVFRQTDDVFVDILNGIRENKLTPTHLELLNKRLDPGFLTSENDGYITLTTHNAQADEINAAKISSIEGKEFVFSAEIKDNFPQHMYPADADLQLKKGAQVMFLKNDTEDKQYFNGKIGTVVDLGSDNIVVQCKGDRHTITVSKDIWENIHYNVDPVSREIEEEKLGSFKQFPLRLAWGITIHKSQGLTFEKLIVDAQKAFSNGQVYVALSRVTSLEGLVLTSPIGKQFLGASQNLKNWEQVNNQEEALPQKLEESRIDCIRQELLQVFDWHIPVQEIVKLKAAVVAIKDNISPDCEPWILEITENILACNKVAKDFQGNIFRITSSLDFVQKQTELQSRLKAAASYFLPKMELLKEELRLHNLAVKTKKAAISLDEPIEEVNQFLHDLLHRLKYFDKGDFNLGEYLENGKINKQKQQMFKSTYEASSTPQSLVSTSEIDHLKLYQAIALYRKGIASKSNEPIYKIFTNNAIKELCKHLPKTEDQLLMVNGFGPIKVKMFGDDVMKLIREYCEDNMVPAKDLFS